METQSEVVLLLPDSVVAFLDRSVAAGVASSRAALVTRVLEAEMRRQAASADVRILQAQGTADDLDDLVAWAVRATRTSTLE